MPLPKKIVSRKDEITNDFIKLVHDHVADLKNGQVNHMCHTSDYAKLLFIHPRHLTNTIKLTTGKSPCDWGEELVIAEVQQLLRETELSIAQIGYRFAYTEPTNFVKFYKSMTGTTPLKYRKSIREEKLST
ncbi:helix-turn-helix domain-containing protein [Pedobacter sp. MC2016-14]|uniref:helix-turn-helix domain-containing protein n=1 Tax=Pedobacter sp. MC2016-14 TaxID=2897327 RepID=UPI001E59B55E|nr:helix-turn-helix domain-containing protein [Pedobacter sp. MC2016-14]MCD0488650.1 helix-turn-helix domain-containing protein [Pedobacter sp. MC2016-14]